MIEYKGYIAKVEYDDSVDLLHASVVNSGSYPIANCEAEDVKTLKKEFRTSIDEYLASCAEDGVEPRAPFSGNPNLHIVELEHVSNDGSLFKDTDVPVQYLFKYLDETHNLYAFLDDFPQVSLEQALTAIRDRVNADIPIHSDRERVSGLPVFEGTRVPVRSLFNYLSYGYTIEGFLENFPTAERKQVLKTLELASAVLESVAYETATR